MRYTRDPGDTSDNYANLIVTATVEGLKFLRTDNNTTLSWVADYPPARHNLYLNEEFIGTAKRNENDTLVSYTIQFNDGTVKTIGRGRDNIENFVMSVLAVDRG